MKQLHVKRRPRSKSGESAMPRSWKRRLARAILIVFALVAAVPASTLMLDGPANPATARAQDDARAGMQSSLITENSSPQHALTELERLAGKEDETPEYFEEEIGMLAGARNIHSNPGGSVIGYVVDLEPSQATAALDKLMAQGGWSKVQLGQQGGSTYIKKGGRCTWALATCTKSANATSIVYRCVVS